MAELVRTGSKAATRQLTAKYSNLGAIGVRGHDGTQDVCPPKERVKEAREIIVVLEDSGSILAYSLYAYVIMTSKND